MTEPKKPLIASSRRDFLRASASVGAAVGLAPMVHAGGNDVLRVGLVGCGGRGTGAAAQAIHADKNTKLVAMGDLFGDRIKEKQPLLKDQCKDQYAVTDDHCFTGIDCYKKVIEVSDVVLLCSPPHFRPAQIKAAIDAGKHVFAEKPVAVDAPGVRAVMEACKKAKEKNLAVVSGLCWRYHPGMRETIKKIQQGAVGKIVAIQANYNANGLWSKKREDYSTDMEWQIRNWLYFTWLSGDHNVEQHIHSLDKVAWVMGDEYPVKAVGLGGRQARTGPEFGHIFDHHAVVYEFASGLRCFSFCRQQDGTKTDTSDWIFGTTGKAELISHTIWGEKTWKYRAARGAKTDMYQQEHDEMFASIRAGKPINNGDYMCKSTLMAIMGRMATYTGQEITWEQAWNSKEDLTPASYSFGPAPTPPVAIPGKSVVGGGLVDA